jgi:hypothetical protein
LAFGAALAIASSAFAAPNVTNASQKGSLLVWPDVRVDQGWNTLIRISNDGSSDVDVICFWMDGNKNRVDIIFTITRNQPVWFDAATGNGTYQVNPFPTSVANGFDNPFLLGPTEGTVPPNATVAAAEGLASYSSASGAANTLIFEPYLRGMLACWAIDGGAQSQVKWNHLSGTATVYRPDVGAYEYNAYSFFVQTGQDLGPVGVPGTLNLNSVEYDSCPLYQIGQFSPVLTTPPGAYPPPANTSAPIILKNRLAIVGCSINLNQDWVPVFTKLVFDVWNEDEVKFTGAFECADTWHETEFNVAPPASWAATSGGAFDSGGQAFALTSLGTYSARYRVQGIKSTQCEDPTAKNPGPRVTQAVGVLAVQSSDVAGPGYIGTTLAAAGKFTGKIVWDPEGLVPEGGIR